VRVVRLRDERGISAIVTAIAMFGVLSSLLLSLDAGNVWQTRRAVVTATDAAALETARNAALFGPATACAGYKSALERNAGAGTEGVTCSVASGSTANTGYVTIEARKPVRVRFGGIYGQGDTTAFSSSSARWGHLTAVEGLRPIGICINNEHVASYLGLGAADLGIHPSPGVHRVMFTKSNPTACGANAPGNWGFLDYDGGANSSADLKHWLEFGYDGRVAIGDCDDQPPVGTRCSGDTGSSGGSIGSTLDKLVASAQPFSVLVFDSVSGSGANVSYNAAAFLGVILRGYNVTGAQNARYFDFEFTRVINTGPCCTVATLNTGVVGLRLCGIDHDSRTAVRCLT
jgi:hypothetical protein